MELEAVTPAAAPATPVTPTPVTPDPAAAPATPVAPAAVTPEPAVPAPVTPAPVEAVDPAKPVEPTVPEKYELKLADGSMLTPEHVKEVETYAKSKGLTNEAAQEMLVREESIVSGIHDQQMKQHEATVAAWIEQGKTDKEFGGDKYVENVQLAHTALKYFDKTGALTKGLDASGFGNHPDVLKVFAEIGKKMANDRLIPAPSVTPPAPKRPQDVLYNGDKARNKS